MSTTLAIDLGGTHVRAARITEGNIEKKATIDCNANGTKEEVLEQLFTLINQVISAEVECIGIGVPSVVNYEKGIVYNVQNIPSWDEVHLKDIIEEKYHIKTKVDNDVNCYVMGEKCFGINKPYKNIVGITIGTGIGAGIIIDGNIYRGTNTGAGEIGCLPYKDADYEQYCSSQWMKRNGLDSKDLYDKAKRGDTKSLTHWKEFGYHLGKFMQAILLAYDPEAIVIGGGISGGASFFKEAMLTSMAENFPYQHEIEKIDIHFSALTDCNLLGASKL